MAFANQLVEQQHRAAEIFASFKNNPSKMPRMNALAAILKESTSRIDREYSDPEKKRTNRLFWIKRRCADTVTDGRPACDLDYGPLDAGSKTYNLTRSKHDGFNVAYREFETSVFDRDEVTSEGIIDTEIRLFQDLNARVHEFLNDPANLTYFDGFSYVVDPADNTVVIPPEKWTPRMMSILMQHAARLGMADPFLISGNALWEMHYDLLKDQGIEFNKGNAARLGDFRLYIDWTMDGTLDEEKVFLIDRGVFAFLNRVDWRNTTPMDIGDGHMAWSKATTVQNLPIGMGLDGGPVTFKIDRHYERDCVSGVDFKDQHGFNLNADIVRQPDDDCSDDATTNGGTFTGKYTGAIAFKCGDPDAVGS